MQILAGSVYRQVAWVVTIFMAGLAVGALAATRWLEEPPPATGEATASGHLCPSFVLCLSALGVAAFALLLPVLLPALARLAALRAGEIATQGIILLFTFGLAALVGAQFPLANALAAASHAAARLYTADFVGASIGALLTSAWLVPAAGVAGVCWITGGLNLLAALGVFRKKGFP
jgi:predicted membrane-bound spermidine synthase